MQHSYVPSTATATDTAEIISDSGNQNRDSILGFGKIVFKNLSLMMGITLKYCDDFYGIGIHDLNIGSANKTISIVKDRILEKSRFC